MNPDTDTKGHHWAQIGTAIAGSILAVVVIFVAVFAISRVNSYQDLYKGVDIVPDQSWLEGGGGGDPGEKRLKTIRTYLLASAFLTFLLACTGAAGIYCAFGTGAAVVYAGAMVLVLVIHVVFFHYLGKIGTRNTVGDEGAIVPSNVVDVGHPMMSLTNFLFGIQIVHAALIGVLGIFLTFFRRKDGKPAAPTGPETDEALIGSGRRPGLEGAAERWRRTPASYTE